MIYLGKDVVGVNHVDPVAQAEIDALARIIAVTESTTTATRAYSIGDYFILESTLYRVTVDISSGGTIVPETNCVTTTVMDEIKSLV